jgi:hypothetical protein
MPAVVFHRRVIRVRQEMYILSQIENSDHTLVLFDMPINTTVQQKGSSAVLDTTLGLYCDISGFPGNAKMKTIVSP